MSLPIYRDIEGELHPKTDTSRHHIFARSLTGGGKPRKFINQYPFTPRMVNEYHYSGKPQGLHENVPLLRPPTMFVIHCLQQVVNGLDSSGQYNQLIEFVDRVDDMSLHHGNSGVRKECGRLAENLECQMPFILRGQVEVVQNEVPYSNL